MSKIKTYEGKESRQFEPFHNTYKVISMCMTVCMIYVNPKTDTKRFAMLTLVYIFFMPAMYLLGVDMFFCILRRDMNNLTRHMTIAFPFLLVMHKMLLMNLKRTQAWQLITIVNRDFARYNTLTEDYKVIVERSVKDAVFFERYWGVIVVAATMVFPIMACVFMIYSFLFEDQPTKYMVHDANKPFAPPADRFDSPYFEIVFSYMFTIGLFYCANFAGYDGLFGIMIHHACLKMKIFCHTLEKAFSNVNDVEYIKQQIKEVIKEQCQTYKFVETIQDTFNVWLGVIFVVTVIQICTCMYQVVEGDGIDLRYIMLLSGTIVHAYLPCYNATLLKEMALETSTRFYTCGWEDVRDVSIRKTLVYMMARGQRPLVITAFNMFTFDMELFVSIMRSSYSMLTLLRP